ncbi:hypothetical protein B7494_g574 [Chlorociboria aeruginascens]|nr:hypothetical protein B7494_g574 [Chlorociboria aeruginascens]
MSPSKPLVYAELLSNIRQISAIVALDTPWNSASKVEVSASGREIIIDHNGETTSLDLPGHVSSNARLQIPVLGSKEVSWRLPLAGPAQHTEDDAQSNGVPWSASSLNEDAEFQCRNCASVLVKRGSIRTWKDLPSENWAEMMDFWHCHKPDLEENGEDRPAGHGNTKNGIASEGYAASSKFRAEPGLGFVDLTTLLFSSTDCMGIQV